MDPAEMAGTGDAWSPRKHPHDAMHYRVKPYPLLTSAVEIELEPGEASLHHGWVMHGSNANASDGRRVGLTIQHAATSVRQIVAKKESTRLVGGRDDYGHFRREPGIQGDFTPGGVAFQRRVEKLKREVYDDA